jgi:hypothetical protein
MEAAGDGTGGSRALLLCMLVSVPVVRVGPVRVVVDAPVVRVLVRVSALRGAAA